MYTGQMVFSQLMDFLPRHEFNQCVRRYQGNYWVRKFSCLDQFLCMVFAQPTYRESLRDTETCLRALQSKLYHVGIRGRVSRSTLADANETRDWRIWADFARVLVGRARHLYAGENFGLALQHSAYALDSTTIDLCLSLFPWARFRRRKGGIRVRTLMDLNGSIPCFIRITAANGNRSVKPWSPSAVRGRRSEQNRRIACDCRYLQPRPGPSHHSLTEQLPPPTSRRVQWIPFPKEGHNEGTVICVSLVTSV